MLSGRVGMQHTEVLNALKLSSASRAARPTYADDRSCCGLLRDLAVTANLDFGHRQAALAGLYRCVAHGVPHVPQGARRSVIGHSGGCASGLGTPLQGRWHLSIGTSSRRWHILLQVSGESEDKTRLPVKVCGRGSALEDRGEISIRMKRELRNEPSTAMLARRPQGIRQ